MKKIQQILLSLTCLMALVIFGVGCGGAVDQTEQAKEVAPAGTITFTEKDPVKGVLRGTYTHEGHVIKFEVIRGEKTPLQALLIYPGVTSHSIDVRVCDANDFCFINGAGGHSLADESWIKESTSTPASEDSLKNFQSVWGLHNDLDLQPAGTFDGLKEEVQSLKDASNQPPDTWTGIPPEYDPLHRKPQQTSCNGTPQKGVLSLATTVPPFTHIFQTWRQLIVYPFAFHSSSYSKAVDANGQIASIYYTCNHGACANGSNGSMMLYCSRNFSNRTTSSLPMNTRCSDPASIGTYHPTNGAVGCCSSMYSYGPLDLSHVCNDDTHLQLDMMIAGRPVVASYCSDRYLQGQAPYCW